MEQALPQASSSTSSPWAHFLQRSSLQPISMRYSNTASYVPSLTWPLHICRFSLTQEASSARGTLRPRLLTSMRKIASYP